MISVVIISKDESALDETLSELEVQLRTLEGLSEEGEILVVDASSGRLDYIRDKHAETVRWLNFQRPADVGVTIPHQRNAGVRAARGDSGRAVGPNCAPRARWSTFSDCALQTRCTPPVGCLCVLCLRAD